MSIGFLRATPGTEETTLLKGERVYLRTPLISDHAQWARVRGDSRAFLTPWEPTWPSDDLTRMAFRRRIRRYQRDAREDDGYALFLFLGDSDTLIGGLTLAHVKRGVTQSCSLGYWMGETYANQGYMSEAVRLVIPYVFGTLKLHRIEAACLPENAPSIRLLEKAGFQKEGYARRYLCINGRWRDHVLFALLADDPVGERVADGPGATVPERI